MKLLRDRLRTQLPVILAACLSAACLSTAGLGFVGSAADIHDARGRSPTVALAASTHQVEVASATHRVTPANMPVPDTTITLYSYGTTLAFDPDYFAVKAGTTVRVRYINEATLAHNFVVVREEDDIDVLGVAAFGAAETGYVPMEHKDRMIAYSELAQPGTTVEVMFTAPPPGDYFFVCLVDGHFNIMVGTLRSIE